MAVILSQRKSCTECVKDIDMDLIIATFFNMDMSFAEWLYSHMRMYKDNSVHDDTMTTVTFEGKEYTIQEAVDWIIENTGEFIRYGYYLDTHFDYITRYPLIGK